MYVLQCKGCQCCDSEPGVFEYAATGLAAALNLKDSVKIVTAGDSLPVAGSHTGTKPILQVALPPTGAASAVPQALAPSLATLAVAPLPPAVCTLQ
jgi:hypothetical protein